MERNGVGMISRNYSGEDFVRLNLSVNSSQDDWNEAIEIFTERFQERYFEPISRLLMDPEVNGFAVMALNCLLIDTFYQFEEGLEETNNNRRCYTQFLGRHLNRVINSEEMAMRFYRDIRCGILHSAQTKNGSQLAYESDNPVEFINGRASIKVDVILFSEILKDYFNTYIDRLLCGDESTRNNFITKMNIICR